MDVTYPAPPTVLTDWKSIGAALEKVVEELALLTTQFASMNSRITNLESAMAARTPIPGPFVTKPPSYIPSSMQGWDDTVNRTDNNILVDVNSPLCNQQVVFPRFLILLPFHLPTSLLPPLLIWNSVSPLFPILLPLWLARLKKESNKTTSS
ncbi:unnamed protein product [Rhizophagus irregularis]|nr:unnamed protein product [Rhizophagus irregularis]